MLNSKYFIENFSNRHFGTLISTNFQTLTGGIAYYDFRRSLSEPARSEERRVSNINDALVSDLLRQASIKTENHLMAFSDSSWKYFPDTFISTGA